VISSTTVTRAWGCLRENADRSGGRKYGAMVGMTPTHILPPTDAFRSRTSPLAASISRRIPERVVHAKGSGAHGYFVCNNPGMSKYTTAKLFSQVGKRTPTFLRFSTVGGEKGSADTERDPRGFALKFYTEEGNWDLVGNNTPVFFIRDPLKFGDFIHTQKRDPETNLKSPTMMWDFWSLSPESLQQVTILFSDRGTPYGYRHMDGFSSHTFSLINAKNELCSVKWHFKTKQGIKNFTGPQAQEMKGNDSDFAQRDLFDSIAKVTFPSGAYRSRSCLRRKRKPITSILSTSQRFGRTRTIRWSRSANWCSIATLRTILRKWSKRLSSPKTSCGAWVIRPIRCFRPG
jgi:hypothetical protein